MAHTCVRIAVSKCENLLAYSIYKFSLNTVNRFVYISGLKYLFGETDNYTV